MKKVLMKMDNIRKKEQLERMIELKKENKCFFCKKNYLKTGASPSIHESKYWYIKKNDYPYEGSTHHYLIVPKKHIKKITEIPNKSCQELLKNIKWLEKKLGINGYSIFLRSGDMDYTGATLDHLHFQLIVGVKKKGPSKIEDNILVTLGHKKR